LPNSTHLKIQLDGDFAGRKYCDTSAEWDDGSQRAFVRNCVHHSGVADHFHRNLSARRHGHEEEQTRCEYERTYSRVKQGFFFRKSKCLSNNGLLKKFAVRVYSGPF